MRAWSQSAGRLRLSCAAVTRYAPPYPRVSLASASARHRRGDTRPLSISTQRFSDLRPARSGLVRNHDPEDDTLAEQKLAKILNSGFLEEPVRMTRHVRTFYTAPQPLRAVSDQTPTLDIARETMAAFARELKDTDPKAALKRMRQEGIGQRLFSWVINSRKLRVTNAGGTFSLADCWPTS
ncbi:hypothetical protein LTR36_002888 [Oleoguttula mirabilis]|uniref:Uncharacterized protein n=1 Tax=Oleoguttula mirabilis TaxID=1507867 RepID=A0AAV9JKQ0_9PEZI|nr:hypothetical protein LTR36_002888 [Oleoguttula mirabilis]